MFFHLSFMFFHLIFNVRKGCTQWHDVTDTAGKLPLHLAMLSATEFPPTDATSAHAVEVMN
jgi:hypothetical protein